MILKIEVGVVSAGPKPEVGVVCSCFSTNQNLYSRKHTFLLLSYISSLIPKQAVDFHVSITHRSHCSAFL